MNKPISCHGGPIDGQFVQLENPEMVRFIIPDADGRAFRYEVRHWGARRETGGGWHVYRSIRVAVWDGMADADVDVRRLNRELSKQGWRAENDG